MRRAVVTSARARAASAVACSASRRGITPTSTSRVARAAAASAATSAASALLATASMVVRSSSTRASPDFTCWPTTTSTRAIRAAMGAPSAADSPGRGTTDPTPSANSVNGWLVITIVSAATLACAAFASGSPRVQPTSTLTRASTATPRRTGKFVTARSRQRFRSGGAVPRGRSRRPPGLRHIGSGRRAPFAAPQGHWPGLSPLRGTR